MCGEDFREPIADIFAFGWGIWWECINFGFEAIMAV